MNRIVHRFHELRTAVRIDSMVSGVVRQHDVLEMIVLCDTGSDRQHNTVTEGYDGRFHILFVIVAFRYGVCTF